MMFHLVLPMMLLALASGCAAFLPLVWQCGGGPVYHVSFEGAACLVQFCISSTDPLHVTSCAQLLSLHFNLPCFVLPASIHFC